MQSEPAAIVIAAPQSLSCLGEQVVAESRGAVIGAQFGLEHVLMAHALCEPGGGRLKIDAVQHLVKQKAVDAAPDPAQPERPGLPEFGDGEDPGPV